MAAYEAAGESDEWYTPAYIFREPWDAVKLAMRANREITNPQAS